MHFRNFLEELLPKPRTRQRLRRPYRDPAQLQTLKAAGFLCDEVEISVVAERVSLSE